MNVVSTIERLFETKEGGKAFDESEKLVRQWAKGSAEAQGGLVRYMNEGRFNHVREHVAAELADLAEEGDVAIAPPYPPPPRAPARPGAGCAKVRRWRARRRPVRGDATSYRSRAPALP